jgi:hypothetical protein
MISLSETPNSGLDVCLGWHIDVAVRFFILSLNRKEPPLNLFQDSRIVINHSTVEAYLDGSIGYEQIFSFVAIEIFNPTFLRAITTAVIAPSFRNRSFLLVSTGQQIP